MASPADDQPPEIKEQAEPQQAEKLVPEASELQPPPTTKTPHPLPEERDTMGSASSPPSTPSTPSPFDWEDFERRCEEALRHADEHERDILSETKALVTYFHAWAGAASAHDDERAVKRLQTRRRFVNLAEEKMAQKQQHYEEVVRAFESALALLRSS